MKLTRNNLSVTKLSVKVSFAVSYTESIAGAAYCFEIVEGIALILVDNVDMWLSL